MHSILDLTFCLQQFSAVLKTSGGANFDEGIKQVESDLNGLPPIKKTAVNSEQTKNGKESKKEYVFFPLLSSS